MEEEAEGREREKKRKRKEPLGFFCRSSRRVWPVISREVWPARWGVFFFLLSFCGAIPSVLGKGHGDGTTMDGVLAFISRMAECRGFVFPSRLAVLRELARGHRMIDSIDRGLGMGREGA